MPVLAVFVGPIGQEKIFWVGGWWTALGADNVMPSISSQDFSRSRLLSLTDRARSIWVRERSNTSPAWNKYSALFSRKDNPEHFMMQNICMATTTTTTFYQNELSRMQNKSIGKTATAQLHLFGQNRKLQFSAPFRRHPRILCVWRTEVLSSKLNVEDYCAQFQQWPWVRGPPARPYLAACCLLRRNTVIRNTQISAITIVIFHRHNFTQLSSTVR